MGGLGIFGTFATMVGDSLFAGDALLGGYLLGLITVFIVMISLTWIIGPYTKGYGFLISAGVGTMFVTLVQWWDQWPIIMIIVLILFTIIDPLGLRK